AAGRGGGGVAQAARGAAPRGGGGPGVAWGTGPRTWGPPEPSPGTGEGGEGGGPPAAIASLSAWRTSPSTWRFIPPAAPKTAAGMHLLRELHRDACMRRDAGGQPAPAPRTSPRGAAAARLRSGSLPFPLRIAPALWLLLAGFLLLCARPLDELDDGEGRRVTVTNAELHDARVAAGALAEARRELVEELLQDAPPTDDRSRAPPRMQRPLLAERDHPI